MTSSEAKQEIIKKIYDAYPRKKGKQVALKAINKAWGYCRMIIKYNTFSQI